ncbi:CDP-alcohol phosphatidyltransferase family protein [bacterium]|nr:MAG: CDP-alcohol phosphatidyltransferase family protein [bacterium]
MKVIIDARSQFSFAKIYSVQLFERILKQLNEMKADVDVSIILSRDRSAQNLLSKRFLKRYKIKHQFISSDSPIEEIIRSHERNEKSIIFLEGNVIYDERILSALIASDKATVVKDGQRHVPLAVRLDATQIRDISTSTGSIHDSLTKLTDSGQLERLEIQSMQNYIRFLRRSVPPMLVKLNSENEIRSIENAMYANSFKGTMEFVAVYGYRIPVRELTRLTAKTPITPNLVTAAAQICSFGAIPFLAYGWLWTGLLLAAGFIIFDSLDGKLARMTIRLSKAADKFDHLTSAPTRMGWYFAIGWYLSNGNLSSEIMPFALAYAAMPVIDKLTGAIFNAKFGRSPLDYTPLDGKVHLFTVRKNDIFLMLIAMIFGFIQTAYIVAACWAVLTWIWHLYRLVWFSLFPIHKTEQE